MVDTALNPSAILEQAKKVLAAGGYELLEDYSPAQLSMTKAILAEDLYCVLLVIVFASWQDLSEQWADAQAALVKVLDERLNRFDPKNWDGYLVMFCPTQLNPSQTSEKFSIESNLSRVRKIIFADEQLSGLADVVDGLGAVLPLVDADRVEARGDVLAALPSLISGEHLTREIVAAVVDAFREGRPIYDEINRLVEKSATKGASR